MKPHIFEGSKGSENCMHSLFSFPRGENCGKRRDDPMHVVKKIIKNIHPPGDPKKRRKIGPIKRQKLKHKVRYSMAKKSRKLNRA